MMEGDIWKRKREKRRRWRTEGDEENKRCEKEN